MHLALSWSFACSPPPVEPAEVDACAAGDDTGSAPADSDSGDDADSGTDSGKDTGHDSGEDSGTVGECAPFGSVRLPGDPTMEGDYSGISTCPTWSGMRDTAPNRAVFRGWDDPHEYPFVVTWLSIIEPTASGSEWTDTVSLFAQGAETGDPHYGRTVLTQGTAAYRCDEAGLWFVSDSRNLAAFLEADSAVGTILPDGALDCSDSPLLLVPAGAELGTTWSTECGGTATGKADYVSEPVDCTYTFTVDRAEPYTTPGGTWEAIHVVVTSASDDWCLSVIAAYGRYFGMPEGFWMGADIGLLSLSSAEFGPVVRLTDTY